MSWGREREGINPSPTPIVCVAGAGLIPALSVVELEAR